MGLREVVFVPHLYGLIIRFSRISYIALALAYQGEVLAYWLACRWLFYWILALRRKKDKKFDLQ